MRKFFKWVLSWFKKPEPKKPQTLHEASSTVIQMGRGNKTTVTQVRAMKNRPQGNVKTSPSQNAKPFDAERLRQAVAASKARSSTPTSQTSYRKADGDDGLSINYVAASSVYASSYGDDGGSYSSGSCDSSSSSSCD